MTIRSVFRQPAFAATAILLLALGTGANAAVFSIVRAILLKPLPYSQPDRLVAIWPNHYVSNRDIGYLRERTRSFEHIAGVSPGWLMSFVPERGEPLKVTGARVSDNLFMTLGVSAFIGRTIAPHDGPTHVAVLSYSLWQSRFGGHANVVGTSVTIDGDPHTIVGVMPRGFEIFETGTELWTPLPYDPGSEQHKASFSLAVARLKPSIPIEMGSREIESLRAMMRRDLGYPNDWGQTFDLSSLHEAIVGSVRPTLLILLGAVGLVLLLAAVNLGTLVLGRSVARGREFAVRAALGASHGRLLVQLLMEQAVLATLGALAGLALARAGLAALVARIPPEIPRVGEISLDMTVFAIVLGLSIAVSLALTVVPVALMTRPSIQGLLRQAHSTESLGRRRALSGFVAAQVALAVVLGSGAGLMLRSMWKLQHVDPGFEPAGVLSFRLQTTSSAFTLPKGLAFFEHIVGRVSDASGRHQRRVDSAPADDGLLVDDQGAAGSAARARNGTAADRLALHRMGLLPDHEDSAARGTRFRRSRSRAGPSGRDRQRGVRPEVLRRAVSGSGPSREDDLCRRRFRCRNRRRRGRRPSRWAGSTARARNLSTVRADVHVSDGVRRADIR